MTRPTTWRKSSHSGTEGNCVEVAKLTSLVSVRDSMSPVWRKSSRSGTEQNACVEVAHLEAQVGVRDSKDPEGGHLVLDRAAARTLVRRAKAGDLDL